MSMDKAIASGKEHRHRYYGAKNVSKSCRTKGGCPYCAGNRTYADRKRRRSVSADMRDALT